MQQGENKRLNAFNYYFVKSLMFYSLKNDFLAKLCFVINFICIFAAFYIPGGLLVWQLYSLYIILMGIICFSSSMYLFSIIKELRNKEYSTAISFKRTRKKFLRLLVSSLVFLVLLFVGSALLILPGIYFVSISFLQNCYIIDLGESYGDSYDASKRMTRPYRNILFKYFLVFFLIIGVAGYMFLTLMGTSGSTLIVTFAFAFYGAAAFLIYHRFIAYLYIDIEYNKANKCPLPL